MSKLREKVEEIEEKIKYLRHSDIKVRIYLPGGYYNDTTLDQVLFVILKHLNVELQYIPETPPEIRLIEKAK